MSARRVRRWVRLDVPTLDPARGVVLVLLAALAIAVASSPQPSVAAETAAPRTLVLAGISGLAWSDFDPAVTPIIWDLAEQSAIGAVVVRGVFQRTCASDGWLTLGTGVRTVAPRIDLPQGVRRCAPLPQPRQDGDGWQIPGWPQLGDENSDYYDPTLGLVTDSIGQGGGCDTAVGPGAALMLADSSGRVDHYETGADPVSASLLTKCPLTSIDLGELPPVRPTTDLDDASGAAPTSLTREQALQQLDAAVGHILSVLPSGATFLLVSTADETAVARIRVLTAMGPGPVGTDYASGLLTTTSTRHAGLVQLTDVTDLVLSTLRIAPIAPIAGTAPTVEPRAADVGTVIAGLIELDERAQVIVRITFPINQAIIVLLLFVYAVFATCGVLISRRRRAAGRTPVIPLGFQRTLATASLGLASVPVATYLANIVPWWRLADGSATGAATAVMLLTSVLLAGALAATVVLLPWAHRAYRAVALVSATTVVVLALDVMTGSHLQFASALGLSPIVAGRFYGFGNVAFSIYATCSVFLCVAISSRWVAAGRRTAASIVVGAFGLVVALIDGWPTFGADFGGMIALIVGFGVFAVLVSTRGISARRLVIILFAGVVFTTLVTVADYLRPAESRTHLGEFVALVVSGDAGSTVTRKLSASLSSFTFSAAAPLIPIVYLVLVWLVWHPARFKATALIESYQATPTLRAGLITVLVIAGLGALVNDSGVIVTATMFGVGVPLAVAAAADPRRTARSPAAPVPPTAQSVPVAPP